MEKKFTMSKVGKELFEEFGLPPWSNDNKNDNNVHLSSRNKKGNILVVTNL